MLSRKLTDYGTAERTYLQIPREEVFRKGLFFAARLFYPPFPIPSFPHQITNHDFVHKRGIWKRDSDGHGEFLDIACRPWAFCILDKRKFRKL